MYVDISQNTYSIVSGKRVMANQWLLPNYVAEGIGNLRFETYKADGDDYVWYEGFNTKFRLVSAIVSFCTWYKFREICCTFPSSAAWAVSRSLAAS